MNIESKSFIYENNVLFNADKTIIIAYRADDKSYNVPDTVTSIGNSAFPMCDSLTSINIPDSVITMEGNPFAGWHGSLSIESKSFIYENQVLFNADKTIIIAYRADDELYNIPNTVTNIGKQSFRAVLFTLIYISTFVPNLNFGQDEHKRRRQVLCLNGSQIPNRVQEQEPSRVL